MSGGFDQAVNEVGAGSDDSGRIIKNTGPVWS